MAKATYKELQIEDVGTVRVVRRKGQKNIRISIKPDYILLSRPWYVSESQALRFLRSKSGWVTANTEEPIVFSDGARIGRYHTLRIEPDRKRSHVTDSHIYTPDDPNLIKKSCLRALQAESENLLKTRLDQLSEQSGLPYHNLHIKHLRSRWGSCDSNHDITLNSLLVQLPWDLIDYVILHELTHTLEMNHSRSFWTKLERVCPRSSELKKTIKNYQTRIYPDMLK
ncbi:MAG: YgjP-like metallopeptidase domain-containing protein [Patescibacteria group bacterium]